MTQGRSPVREIRSLGSVRGAPGNRGPYRDHQRAEVPFRTGVRPAKAGMFSGRQTHRGRSQSPVAWVAEVEETKPMKPTDKAIFWMVSESPGRNGSEPIGGPENLSLGGRAFFTKAKAAWVGAD